MSVFIQNGMMYYPCLVGYRRPIYNSDNIKIGYDCITVCFIARHSIGGRMRK